MSTLFQDQDNNIYSDFIKDAKEYLKTRYILLKLELLEKLAKILSIFVLIIISLILILAALIYFSFAAVSWMKNIFGDTLPGFLIIGGFFLLIFLIVYLARKKLFLNPLIGVLSGILFEEKKEDEDEED